MNRADILATARQAITVDRAATHGSAENNFSMIAALWSADMGVPFKAIDVARLMVLFKVARAKSNPAHHDNAVDCAGYAALMGEIGTAPTLPKENLTPAAHTALRVAAGVRNHAAEDDQE